MTRIASVFAWEALDSRGRPTVGCRVRLTGGTEATIVVPSGASTGRHEARELRDGDERYAGQGVRRAVTNVNTVLGPAVVGMEVTDQRAIDRHLRALDGTPDLSRMGANAVLAVSLAAWQAAALAPGGPLWPAPVRLPMPMFNILSGGAHASGLMDVQDLLAVPLGATTFAQAVEWGWRVRRATAWQASARGLPTALVADEGGLGLPLASRDALRLLLAGIEAAGLQPGHDVAIAVDVAASQLVRSDHYHLEMERRRLDRDEWLAELLDWIDEYPIVSVEDPFGEDDTLGWRALMRQVGQRLQVVGDDLFATSLERVRSGLNYGLANAVLVKPNQIGTVSDALEVLSYARAHGMGTVLSARSGDTEDDWLATAAAVWGADQIKVGSLTRSERTAKWNRLLLLEADPDLDTELGPWQRPADRQPTRSS